MTAQVRYTKEGNVWMVWVGSGVVRSCPTERKAKNLASKLRQRGF